MARPIADTPLRQMSLLHNGLRSIRQAALHLCDALAQPRGGLANWLVNARPTATSVVAQACIIGTC